MGTLFTFTGNVVVKCQVGWPEDLILRGEFWRNRATVPFRFSSPMHTAGRTSSKLGFNTRQSAGFDAVAHVLPGGTRSEHVDFIEFHHPKLEVYRVYCQEMGKLAQREDATPIGCKRFIAIFGFGGEFFTHASRTASTWGTHGSQTTRPFLTLGDLIKKKYKT